MFSKIQNLLKNWIEFTDGISCLFLVGGAVRDHLLAKSSSDIDLICRNAKQVAQGIARKSGAAFVAFEKKKGEPCYRVINRNSGAFVDFSEIRGSDLARDLAARDFTINAMAAAIEKDGKIGEIIDPLGGGEDLQRKVIKICGSKSFSDDPLRILRAVRFAAELAFQIDPGTLSRMRLDANNLASISNERILSELTKILLLEKSERYFRLMDELGILETIFPEIKPMKGCEQNDHHHLDVWGHSLVALENCEQILANIERYFGDGRQRIRGLLGPEFKLPVLKLATLFHDVGKPVSWKWDASRKKPQFLGHDQTGAKIVAKIAKRLRMAKKERSFMEILVAEHLHVVDLTLPEVKNSTKMRWFRKYHCACIPIIIMAMADALSKAGPLAQKTDQTSKLMRLQNLADEYLSSWRRSLERRPLLNGHDLIALGISPGPELGRILNQVRDAYEDGFVSNRKQALDLARRLRESSGP